LNNKQKKNKRYFSNPHVQKRFGFICYKRVNFLFWEKKYCIAQEQTKKHEIFLKPQIQKLFGVLIKIVKFLVLGNKYCGGGGKKV
jgi:hypothetical protein